MKIEYLVVHPSLIPELARLHHGEWSYLKPGESLPARIRRLESYCGRHGVPTTVVAVENGILKGSALLIERDMDTHPALTPWLAGVFVKSEYRRQGVGRSLVRRIEEEAMGLGITVIYLYTPNKAEYYRSLGWMTVEQCIYLGIGVTIMKKELEYGNSHDES